MKYSFKDNVLLADRTALRRASLETLQVNLGNVCNQRCIHCHVNAGPEGDKVMPIRVIDDIIRFLFKAKGLVLDITGGSPELNPNFRYFIESSRPYTKEIIVRNNLTVLFEQGMEALPAFYKRYRVKLICSMPCYTKENVDRQRGEGVFDKSIKALGLLNDVGYGKKNDLQMDLVYNPSGAFLPADQSILERDYKKVLLEKYGIVFNRLLTITNAPINRFEAYLKANGDAEMYMKLLIDGFNKDIVCNVMCRNLLSVGWDGAVYDCDFNQALGLTIRSRSGEAMKISDLDPEELEGKEIIFEDHCYCCTAGAGSSCKGSLKMSK